MSHTNTIPATYEQALRASGEVLTPIRSELLSLLCSATTPLCARELLSALHSRGISAHRATVYRDLELFVKHDLVSCYTFKNTSVAYYEITTDHHHHLVCESCGVVTKIYPNTLEKAIARYETEVLEQKGYRNLSHRLKFYGFCADCSKNI